HPEAEAEEPERRQPLHRDPERALEILRAEAVGLWGESVRAVERQLAAGLKDVADVEERADARRLRPLGRHREDDLVLADDAEIPAIGVAEMVLGAQAALTEAAHRVRTPAEELPVRRDGGGAAQGRAVVDAGEERERQEAVHGHV